MALLSNYSSSSLSATPQSSSAVPPMTIVYSTPIISSTVQDLGTNATAAQTTEMPFWEEEWLGENPYQSYWISYSTSAPMNSGNHFLFTTCGSIWSSSLVNWISTEIASSGEQRFVTYEGGEAIRTIWDFPFTPSAPCCSSCAFTAGDVQVYRWPQTTSAPSISTLVNPHGFIFTYPSVYVEFKAMLATDMCGLVGSQISVTTIGFDATELSTAPFITMLEASELSNSPDITMVVPNDESDAQFFFTNQPWWTYSVVDYAESIICTPTSTTLSIAPCCFGLAETFVASSQNAIVTPLVILYTPFPILTIPFTSSIFSYNPCSPYLSMPARVRALDPRWGTCIQNFRGLHDPPNILNTENGFSIVTTTRDGNQASDVKTSPPAVGQGIQQPTPTQTPPSEDNPSQARPLPTVSRLPLVATYKETQYTVNSASELVIQGQTLHPGGEITDSNNILSMAPNGRSFIIGGTSTQLLDTLYGIGTQTVLAGGPAVTVSGIAISVQPGGLSVVIGGSTTEDLSAWLRGGPSKSSTRPGGSSTSPQGAESVGASKKLEMINWVMCQVALLVIVGIRGFL